MGSRMTVIRLANGGLLLHSPVATSPELLDAVRGLGEVSYMVAPNRFHHLHVAEWQREFSSAALYLARGLGQKRPELQSTQPLPMPQDAPWRSDVDHLEVEGVPLMNEVVFFHRSTRTLVIADLAFHIGEDAPLSTRWFFRLSGSYGRLAPTRLEKLMVRDRAAFCASLRQVLAWPFERVVMAHGDIIPSGGRDALAAGYASILGSRDRSRAAASAC